MACVIAFCESKKEHEAIAMLGFWPMAKNFLKSFLIFSFILDQAKMNKKKEMAINQSLSDPVWFHPAYG